MLYPKVIWSLLEHLHSDWMKLANPVNVIKKGYYPERGKKIRTIYNPECEYSHSGLLAVVIFK
ncbi:2739_t:CDS:2 [Gigaspora margarita]|uniref:2739_t:CDS:1 n=1 Tax=Gigaspora margarita TaxID=4874 RepID=A0ABN7UUU1_GIGMA|nr:2739_t:CDS:2 [Gigaspora margarita]